MLERLALGLPRAQAVWVDLRTALFTACLAIPDKLVAGAWPAVRVSRGDVGGGGGGHGAVRAGGHRASPANLCGLVGPRTP